MNCLEGKTPQCHHQCKSMWICVWIAQARQDELCSSLDHKQHLLVYSSELEASFFMRPPEFCEPIKVSHKDLKLGENLLCSSDGFLNVLVGMSKGHESSLVLRGCEVDATLKHASMPLGEFLCVTLRSIRETLHRALIRKTQ